MRHQVLLLKELILEPSQLLPLDLCRRHQKHQAPYLQ